MKSLQPVIWTKGTILTPQHLQLQDRFLENLLQFHLENLSFRPWGFVSLQINQEALAAGMLGISRASGILADGLPFEIPESDTAPAPKPLADHFHSDRSSVDFYLGLPHYRERGVNVGAAASARYHPYVEPFRDENTGLSEKLVQIARKNFSLLAEGEARDGYSTLRVARVRRTEAGTFQVDSRCVPPMLNFRASTYLVSIARRLVEILSARSSTIAGVRRQKNQTLADFTAADIANFWLLYTLNTALPTFRHLFEVRGGHPETLYSAMLSVAGALTTFSTTIHPRDLPVYDHDDLGACFTDLDEKLRNLLDTVVPSNFVALPLKQVQPAIYATSLDHDKYLLNTRMYFAINAETTQAEIVSRTPMLVKVCSASHIEHLVRQALPGVTLTYVPSPPSAIPVKLNYHYFSLNQSGGAWEAIVRSRNLAAYVPADLPNAQMELLIVLPQAS
jgi:type VI secretion system protein ImpJ